MQSANPPVAQREEVRRTDKAADLLFDYLGDVLYNPKNATLNLNDLPEDFRKLGEGLIYFAKNLDEMRDLAKALSKGNLSVQLPPPENEMAAPLKALNASLKHMTWQSQQVAKGDYQQRVEFMGEFAEAFNTMTRQLDQRQKALEAEIESGRKKNLALEQSNSLFAAITERIPQWIIVMDLKDKEKLFLNDPAADALAADPQLEPALVEWMDQHAALIEEAGMVKDSELELPTAGGVRYLSVTAYPLHWRQHSAAALILADVSAEKQHMRQLEDYAYRDTLTRVHNRFFGMQVLREWLEEDRSFCVCFADLDNLKYVNDTFGHSEGDNYIIAAAEVMIKKLPEAVVCRLGGDEFMVLIDGCAHNQGEATMKDIRSALMASNKGAPNFYPRSISYGVVGVSPGEAAMTASELLGLADERMYAYKRAHKKQRWP